VFLIIYAGLVLMV